MNKAFINHGSLSVRELPLHRNIGMEIVYVSQGVLRWMVDGRIETLYPDTVFFTLPWQVHGSEAIHEPGNRIHFIQMRLDQVYHQSVPRFCFHPQLDIPTEEAQRVSGIFASTKRNIWQSSQDLRMLIPALLRNLDRNADPLLIQGYARSIIAELAGIVAGEISPDVHRTGAEQRVLAFLESLSDSCDQPWSLAGMAKACHIGRSLFSETMHRLTGDSPTAHLRRLRIMRAEALLIDTDDRITDIALETGFSTTQLFARTFKEFTNRTPTEYRRNARIPLPDRIVDFSEADEEHRRSLAQRHDWL